MSSKKSKTFPIVFPADFLPERWMSGTFGQGVKYLNNERVAEGVAVDESVIERAVVKGTKHVLCAPDDGDYAALSQSTPDQGPWGMCWAVAKASEVTKLVSIICFGRQLFTNWTKDNFAGATAPSPVESFQDFNNLFFLQNL
jgi:hypothetical protein